MPHVRTRTARQTKRPVELWNNREGDFAENDGEENWYTVCTVHSTVCSHVNYVTADYLAARPKEWCECCAEHVGGLYIECVNCGMEPPDYGGEM